MTRLFVAIDLPQQQKDSVSRVFTRLPGARWVPAEQIHLTLRFLGEVEEKEVPAIKGALESFSYVPFPLTLRGVGHFPPGKYPRVLWVGLEPSPPLSDLYDLIQASLSEVGFLPEERKFSPHITLARLHGTPAAATDEVEAAHRDFCCAPFTVREFYLYSSVLTRTGAIHTREGIYCAEPNPEQH